MHHYQSKKTINRYANNLPNLYQYKIGKTNSNSLNHYDAQKYDIIPIYISKERTWYTGKMLMDIDVFRNFDDLKKYASKLSIIVMA